MEEVGPKPATVAFNTSTWLCSIVLNILRGKGSNEEVSSVDILYAVEDDYDVSTKICKSSTYYAVPTNLRPTKNTSSSVYLSVHPYLN